MRSLPFTLEQIRTFVAVVEAGSMTKAASRLFLTQGAVTQQVQHFEQALGLQLLERTPKGIALTEAGRRVLDACTLAGRDLEAIGEVGSRLRKLESGSLRIGAGRTAASFYLPGYLKTFLDSHPNIDVSVVVVRGAVLQTMVVNAVVDCAVTSALDPATLSDPRIEVHVIAEEQLVAVAARDHPLASATKITSEALAMSRHIVVDPGPVVDDPVPVRAQTSANYGDPEAAQAAVLAGIGYAILPEVAVRRDLDDRLLVRLPLPATTRWTVALRRSNSRVPALRELWDVLTGTGP